MFCERFTYSTTFCTHDSNRLERELNFARNVAVDDASFAQQAMSIIEDYEQFCSIQRYSLPPGNDPDQKTLRSQALAALERAIQFTKDIASRCAPEEKFLKEIMDHYHREPNKGTADAVLVIPCSSATIAMPDYIPKGKVEQDEFLKTFILVHGKPEKEDVPTNKRLQVPRPSSLASQYQKKKEETALVHDVYLVSPDRTQAINRPLVENAPPDLSGQDLLLPVLLSEYKKKDQSTIKKAMNQMRTYVVSAIRFLHALGIADQPVFGLVVNGSIGAVTMAWEKNKVCTPPLHCY